MNMNDALAVVTALHLDYISCLLTIASTILVGRRKWQGWVVAAINSVIISVIGLRTGQWGLVPANIFCLAIYAYNLRTWRTPAGQAVHQEIAGMQPSPERSSSVRSA
jgi:nicotinamide riboside transporter PnuC